MIKAIIFDLGSVCVNIDWIKINEEMMKKFGINILVKSSGDEKLIQLYNDTLEGKKDMKKDFFKELNKNNHNLEEITNFYKEVYKKYKSLNKDIWSLIKKLRKNIKVACLTDTNSIHFETHREQKIIERFDYAFSSFQLGSRKADKNTFIKVLEKLELKPEEVIFIDDSEKNVNNAKSLGINTIKFENFNQLKDTLRKFEIY
ncbi:MAG: HAD-IA family hydrolase [Candidatus Pacearchaeota archaeon]|nr:HAD-IA family hydrolase [Candidatus Pacearchaeota archaeon]